MKVRFIQSAYVLSEDRVFNCGDEFKLDKDVAKEMIAVGYAEEVVVEKKPSAKKTTNKTKVVDNNAKD